jgi:glycosyltransferase involved in cell wall biosynthesis
MFSEPDTDVNLVTTGVSVVICCYNSASRIGDVLKHLAKQKTNDSVRWEIVLVDNASTDNTQEAATKFWNAIGQKTTLRVVQEPKPGLSYARERGMTEARYNCIIFCDDDNWLCDTYIQTAYDVMAMDANIGIAGGWCEAEINQTVEKWAIPFLPALAVGRPAEKTTYLASQGKFVNGAGMIIRKEHFNDIKSQGFYSLLDDRKHNTLSSGGDTELCWAMMFAGREIYFHESLFFRHYIPPGRLKKDYLLKLTLSSLYPSIILSIYSFVYWNHFSPFAKFFIKEIFSRIYSLFYYGPRMIFGRYPLYCSVVFRQNLKIFGLLFTRFPRIRKDFCQIKNFIHSLSKKVG